MATMIKRRIHCDSIYFLPLCSFFLSIIRLSTIKKHDLFERNFSLILHFVRCKTFVIFLGNWPMISRLYACKCVRLTSACEHIRRCIQYFILFTCSSVTYSRNKYFKRVCFFSTKVNAITVSLHRKKYKKCSTFFPRISHPMYFEKFCEKTFINVNIRKFQCIVKCCSQIVRLLTSKSHCCHFFQG